MKDKITVGISIVALIFSIASATLSYQLQKLNSERSAKDQLNRIVSDLIDLNAKGNALWSVPEQQRDTLYYQTMSLIPHKASAISRQAVYLAESNPDMVTDVEFATIAQGLVIAGDNFLAGNYWKKAVSASPSNFYKVVNLRGYANFLFSQGNHESARSNYQEALKIFSNDTDFNKRTNGYTYQMWMNDEFGNGFREEAEKMYQRAQGLYESVSSPFVKTQDLTGLDAARSRFSVPPKLVGYQ